MSTMKWKDVPTRTIDVGGVPFAYRELGPSSGVPVIFLHHLMAVLDDWDPRVIDGIAEQRRVIAFDNRGIGASGGAVPNTVEDMGRDAIAFIHALGLKQVDLLGFSLGGGVAQMVALQAPDLVRRMVLAGTGPKGGGGIEEINRVAASAYIKAALTLSDPRNFLFFPRTPDGKRAAKDYFSRLKERTLGRDKPISLRARRAQLKAIKTAGLSAPDDLSVITQPVFIANGDHDLMVASSLSADMARRLPNAKLTIYPDAGHGGVFQHHRTFVPEVLNFLADGPQQNQHDRRTMKALTFKRYGKQPEIGFTDLPRPTPKPDELLVQVHAAGLNPIDNMIPTGMFKPVLKFQLPATLGSDLAGVVTEVGSRVTRFKPGDEVFASIFDLGTGSIAEFAVVPESAAALKPANLDFVQAASIPMVGLTSWQALKERAHLQAGQKVFIPAGSGGIGTFAIQLAKHLGAKVGTTTSTGNVALVRSLGADEVVDYKKQEFQQVLRGYDVVLGTVRGDAIENSIDILKPGSKIVSLIGPLDAAFARARRLNFGLTFVFGLMSRKIMRLAKKRDVAYSFHFVRPDGGQLAEIGELLKSERIRPVIDKVFPFVQAKEALEYLALGRAKGKVVIKIQ